MACSFVGNNEAVYINDNLIRTIECLYNKATSAVYHDNNIGEWFRTTIGVRQGCLLSPTLFNIFLERIMADALEDHEGTASIGGRTITNLRFADDIDGLAGEEQELVKLVNHLEEASTAYGMQISAEKTQLMTNNTNGISTDITIGNKKLETVHSFKCLGAIVSDEGSKPEVLSRIAQTTAAVTKLKVIWNDKNIAISSKIRLIRSLAMSIFLYACETWTITADIERRIQALEMRCFHKLLGISYRDHITKTILQGTVQGGRRRGRQRKRWEDNIKEWTGLQWNIALRKAENREEWRNLVVKSTVVPQRSARLRDR